MENCAKCGMPLEEDAKCSCNPSLCAHCCECPEDCGCGCKTKGDEGGKKPEEEQTEKPKEETPAEEEKPAEEPEAPKE